MTLHTNASERDSVRDAPTRAPLELQRWACMLCEEVSRACSRTLNSGYCNTVLLILYQAFETGLKGWMKFIRSTSDTTCTTALYMCKQYNSNKKPSTTNASLAPSYALATRSTSQHAAKGIRGRSTKTRAAAFTSGAARRTQKTTNSFECVNSTILRRFRSTGTPDATKKVDMK